MEIYHRILILYFLQTLQASFCSSNWSHILQSTFNHLTQSCTCSYTFSPPPCSISSAPISSPYSHHTTPLPISLEGLHSNSSVKSADPLTFTNILSPWEAIVAQLLHSLTKVPHGRAVKPVWNRLLRLLPNRQAREINLKSDIALEDFNIDLLTPLLSVLSKHQPSYTQLQSPRWSNRTWQTSDGQRKLPRPLEIYKRLETVAHLYNYAIFEPICSLYVYSADAELVSKCIEYWFTNWPYRPIPNYHCSPSYGEGVGG